MSPAASPKKEYQDIVALKGQTSKVLGIDVSYHQGVIDWKKVADFGIKFCYFKATEGSYYLDPKFLENWNAAGEYGILRGSYHYALLFWKNKITSGKKEALNFIRQGLLDKNEIPPMLDLEPGEVSPIVKFGGAEAAVAWINEFIEEVEKYLKVPPGLYTHHRIMKDEMLGAKGDVFKRLYTWWARYVSSLETILKEGNPPNHPEGWGYNIWQFTSQGQIPGITGNCDVNIFNGNEAQFGMWAKLWKNA